MWNTALTGEEIRSISEQCLLGQSKPRHEDIVELAEKTTNESPETVNVDFDHICDDGKWNGSSLVMFPFELTQSEAADQCELLKGRVALPDSSGSDARFFRLARRYKDSCLVNNRLAWIGAMRSEEEGSAWRSYYDDIQLKCA